MKKAMLGTMLATFALAPAMAWADCDFHKQEAMAQMASAKTADKAPVTQANASHKASTPAVAKASTASSSKRAGDKTAQSSSKSDATTVVAKSN